jgi:hypothetical protein
MKPKPQPSRRDDPEQSRRFVEMARELGPDETGEKFDRAFKKVAQPKKLHQKRDVK